jgi:hypothetical protein
MTPAQLVSIGTVVAGLVLLWIQSRKAPPAVIAAKSAVPDKA